MSGKSYSINQATNTGIIKDHSFRSCIKILALIALIFFIVTVLILCWIKQSNGPIGSMPTTTTENYGVHDKVVQSRIGPSSNLSQTHRRPISTTPRPNFNHEAHLHGPNIDEPSNEDARAYGGNTFAPETDLIANSTMNSNMRKMDIRLVDIEKTTTDDNFVVNSSTSVTTLNASTMPPEMPQLASDISLVLNSENTIENISNVFPTISEPKLTTLIMADETTTEHKNIPQTITTTTTPQPSLQQPVYEIKTDLNPNILPTLISVLPSTQAAIVESLTTIPICPPIPNITVPICPTPLPVCETVECRKSSSKIFSLLNHESDPCDNFYAFTCSASNLNDVDLSNEDDDIYGIDFNKLDSNIEYIKKYKRFYDSCMTYDKDVELSLMKKHLKEIHIENGTVTNKASQLADLLADILKFGVYGSITAIIPVIDIVMDLGPDGKFIPAITVPMGKSLMLDAGEGDYYEKKCLKFTESKSKEIDDVGKIHEIFENCMQNSSLYETVLKKSLDQLSIYENKENETKVITDVMWEIIDEIGAISKVEKIQIDDKYDPVYHSLNELQLAHPEINWQRFFTSVFSNEPFVFDKIKIMYPEYLTKILEFYKRSNYHDIMGGILAMVAHDFYVEYLDGPVLVNGNDRKRFCAKLTTNTMKEISTKILLNKYSEEQIKYKENMVEKIFIESKEAFSDSIGIATELTSADKEIFVNKITNIKLIGKSSEFYKVANINEMYADIAIQDSLVYNTLAMRKFRQKFMYSLMSKKYLKSEYFWTYLVSPLEPSVRTFIELDTIVIPLRFLTKSIPNANKMKQKYEIYSKVSYQIAHGLSSFFSPKNIRKFWEPQNIYKNFAATNLIDPYITQISNPYDLELDKDSIRYTLNSRFNDDAAILIALDTYRWKSANTDLPLPWLNLTIPQLYYVTFAQQFCYINSNRVKTAIDTIQSDKLQNYFRLNSVIMNSKNFPDEFSCSRGTNMNPSLKIEQFPHFDTNTYDEITDNAT